jgi:putative addiction module component (TIGR02574 family)
MRCADCGGRLVSTTADLPFQVDAADHVTLKNLPVRACERCSEIVIDDAVMADIDGLQELVGDHASLPDAQRPELDRRVDDLEREGPVGLTWDEMVAKARRRRR